MKVFVQFQDSSEEVVIASFSCTQDPEAWPHQGVIDQDDPRYVAFAKALPKPLF